MNSTIEQIKLTLIVFLVEIRRGEQHNIMAGYYALWRYIWLNTDQLSTVSEMKIKRKLKATAHHHSHR